MVLTSAETKREITHEVTRIVGVKTVETGSTEKISYKPLSEVKEFYDVNGVSLLEPYKTITITQGDGQTASVTLYPSDTQPEKLMTL